MLKRISVSHLRQGMYIHEFCGSWMGRAFWRPKFLLDDSDDLRRILVSGADEVWIDISKGIDVAGTSTGEPPEQVAAETDAHLRCVETNPAKRSSATLEDEVKRASKFCYQSKDAVLAMFSEVRMGQAIDIEYVGKLVEEIADSVTRNPDALISLARLKSSDEYTYMHSIAVCALMIALARQLRLSEELVREAGVAGLLHDIGKLKIPDAILNKPGKLTEAEFSAIRHHPSEGAKLLKGSEKISELVLDVCLHHHEKVDGSGYPDNLKGDEISLFAKMGAVCDVYDAITSSRPYKDAWSPAEAVRKMAEWSKGHFDQNVFHAFVKSVGIYPTGSLVRLQSGRLGVVTDQHPTSLLMPKVKVFFHADSKTQTPHRIIDLSTLEGHEKIIGREAPEDWNFYKLDELWSGLQSRDGSYFF